MSGSVLVEREVTKGGLARYVPLNLLADTLCKIAGRPTLTRQELGYAEKLGFEVNIRDPAPSVRP